MARGRRPRTWPFHPATREASTARDLPAPGIVTARSSPAATGNKRIAPAARAADHFLRSAGDNV